MRERIVKSCIGSWSCPIVAGGMVLLAVVVSILPARIARGQQANPGAGSRPAKSVAARLGNGLLQTFQSAWPDPPESVAMFVDILAGSQLGPGEGWFKKGVTQSRFDWKTTVTRLDRDGDGRISRQEFAGADDDFARLDRDHDGFLSQPDFDFSAHALTPSPGAILFYRADIDGNGKLTAQELEAFFQAADSSGTGFLSLADVQEALGTSSRTRGSAGVAAGPTRLTLLKGLARQELGSLQPGPAVGAPAPDFTLKTVDGRQEMILSKLVGERPVVLVFGNFTCGPFRSQAGNVDKLYNRYRDRATFIMVYVREAHPIGGWVLDSNNRVGVAISQPRSDDERIKVAQTCSSRLGLGMPVLVDTIDDAVGARYSGMPSRLYLIDRRGQVAFKNGRGPFGFKPAELEHALILLLREEFPELKSKDSRAGSFSSRPKNDPAAQRTLPSSTTITSPAPSIGLP